MINPNWFEDHKASQVARAATDAAQAAKIGAYKVPEGKDYLADLTAPGLSKEQQTDHSFAPLLDFLELNKLDEKDRIMGFMMFMYEQDGQFYYKNDCTREYIVIDRTGRVVSEQAEALYWYDDGAEDEYQQHMAEIEGKEGEEDPEEAEEGESRSVGGGYKEGVTYRSTYWGKTYRVIQIHAPYTAIPWSDWAVTVEWEDGNTSTHCTPLSEKDTVIG